MGCLLKLRIQNAIASYISVTKWSTSSDSDSDSSSDDNSTESNPTIVEPIDVEEIMDIPNASLFTYDIGDYYAKIDLSGLSDSPYELAHFGPDNLIGYRDYETEVDVEYVNSIGSDFIIFENLSILDRLYFSVVIVDKTELRVQTKFHQERLKSLIIQGNNLESKIVCTDGLNDPESLRKYGKRSVSIGSQVSSPGSDSVALGDESLAFGRASIAIGWRTKAIGLCAHAAGYKTLAQGIYSHAEGSLCAAYGRGSHAEGNACLTKNEWSHAEGGSCVTSGRFSHAEGFGTSAIKEGAHSQGYKSQADGVFSFASGYLSSTGGGYAQSLGYRSWANGLYSIALGRLNSAFPLGATVSTNVGDVLRVGNGVIADGTIQRSTAFRVTYSGDAYVAGEMNTGGADYAEFFEWKDGNPNSEDRVGRFVTLDGEFIRYASQGDYILGIVSGNPAVVGNSDEDYKHRWLKDDFGRLVREYLEPSEELIDTSEASEDALEELRADPEVEKREGAFYRKTEVPTDHVTSSWRHKQSPDYNPDQPYTERKDRPEWDYVGMLGVLAVYEDGTCEVNSYCQCGENGIATKASMAVAGQSFRVIKRIAPNIVKVVFR